MNVNKHIDKIRLMCSLYNAIFVEAMNWKGNVRKKIPSSVSRGSLQKRPCNKPAFHKGCWWVCTLWWHSCGRRCWNENGFWKKAKKRLLEFPVDAAALAWRALWRLSRIRLKRRGYSRKVQRRARGYEEFEWGGERVKPEPAREKRTVTMQCISSVGCDPDRWFCGQIFIIFLAQNFFF